MEENREGRGSFFSQAQFCYKIIHIITLVLKSSILPAEEVVLVCSDLWAVPIVKKWLSFAIGSLCFQSFSSSPVHSTIHDSVAFYSLQYAPVTSLAEVTIDQLF